jgi:hypothetical protein
MDFLANKKGRLMAPSGCSGLLVRNIGGFFIIPARIASLSGCNLLQQYGREGNRASKLPACYLFNPSLNFMGLKV